jgi:peptidoglycan/LPS O-acetylase OafA/YrhL
MDRRKEIDGLRAFAVLSVLFCHAGFKVFSGGFVGVDIFFVISGYLITTIISKELEHGKFSIINFYERRARRILPALFLVTFLCIPFAWLFLGASEYRDFSKSLIAVSVFGSNFLFWKESGYFETAAELKPLLHTWSLSLEEQYYIFYPLILKLLWKFGKSKIRILLGALLLVSFVFAQWATYAKPSAAFYLLPTRIWELLIGAFAAFYLSQNNRKEVRGAVGGMGGWLGLALIVYPVFAYSSDTRFPGLSALVPTLGTALIILFATPQNALGKFLGNKLFVGIGLLSYSAYLFHHPLFAFARNSGSEEPSQTLFSFLLLVTMLCAYLSWKFVESPFRTEARFNRKQVFRLALLGGLFIFAVGTFGYIKDRITPNPSYAQRSIETKTDKNFVIVGDSHGGHLVPGFASITKGNVQDLTSPGCIPFRNVDRYDSRFTPGDCAKKINYWLDQVINADQDAVIVLSTMGPIYLDGIPFKGKDIARVTGLGVELITDKSIKDKYRVFEIGLRQTLSELSKLDKSKVVFALDIPELGIDDGCRTESIETDLTTASIQNCFVLRSEYDLRVERYKKLVTDVISDFPAIFLFDPTSDFCDEKVCKGYDPEFGYLYQDVDHLSASGSRFYAEIFVRDLNQKNLS